MDTPQEMTLDQLAILVNKGFENTATKADIAAVRAEMATKVELGAVREEMVTMREELKGDIAGLRAEMHEEFERIERERNYGQEIDELRMNIL